MLTATRHVKNNPSGIFVARQRSTVMHSAILSVLLFSMLCPVIETIIKQIEAIKAACAW